MKRKNCLEKKMSEEKVVEKEVEKVVDKAEKEVEKVVEKEEKKEVEIPRYAMYFCPVCKKESTNADSLREHVAKCLDIEKEVIENMGEFENRQRRAQMRDLRKVIEHKKWNQALGYLWMQVDKSDYDDAIRNFVHEVKTHTEVEDFSIEFEQLLEKVMRRTEIKVSLPCPW